MVGTTALLSSRTEVVRDGYLEWVRLIGKKCASPGGRASHADTAIGAEVAHLGEVRAVGAYGHIAHLGVGDASG